ncbi:hypothetical protein TrCOL_g10261 [Triparma columacea]|uniref:Uncharacterized protein n=1 Tax=Triparma columacea TaxID=722753 RepID=A0A9W7G0M2_9STRA|nr:hypothetical protein TrCOL_g10261 [Triparma columacea]
MANKSAGNDYERANVLAVMEENVEEIEELLVNMPSVFPDYLALLFASASEGGGIAAYEVLQLSAMVGGGGGEGGGRCIEALSKVVCNGNLENSIRAGCLKCMSELGIPATYLRDKGEVTRGESGDMDIASLSKLYTSNLNSLVNTACNSRFVLDVGQAAASLIKNFGSTDEAVELGLKIMEHLMNFIIRLMVHATENYAKLRLSLTEQSPTVVPLAILPFIENVLSTPAGLLGPVFQRRLLFAMQSLAILTYKVKTVRGIVGGVHEENLGKIVRLIGEGRLWKHPELLAALFKLHINIEGGHGPNWSKVHSRVSSMLLGEHERLVSFRGGGVIFNRCVKHNADGVPCNRASRAFNAFCPVFGEIGAVRESGGGKGKKTKNRKRKKKRMKKKKKKGGDRGYEGQESKEGGVEEEEKLEEEEEKEKEKEKELEGGESKEEMEADEGEEEVGEYDEEGKFEPNSDSDDTANFPVVDISTLQLDELDDLFFEGTGLDVGRGPPPAKFMCSLSGEIMHEPVQDPFCDEPRYYDKTSLVQKGEEEDDPYWPRTKERIDVDKVLKMVVDKRIVDEIRIWKERM